MSTPDLDQFVTASVLSEGHIMTTAITTSDGTQLTSGFDLDSVIGNVNGVLAWGGQNFSQDASNIQMNDGGQLECDLPDGNGNMVHSMMWIGSIEGTDDNNKPAIHHYVVTLYSQAHAWADTNAQADQGVQSQAATTNQNKVQTVSTVVGDAANYWPDGNAPASGHSRASSWPWQDRGHFVLMIIECIARFFI